MAAADLEANLREEVADLRKEVAELTEGCADMEAWVREVIRIQAKVIEGLRLAAEVIDPIETVVSHLRYDEEEGAVVADCGLYAAWVSARGVQGDFSDKENEDGEAED